MELKDIKRISIQQALVVDTTYDKEDFTDENGVPFIKF